MNQNHPTLYLIRHGETEWALARRHTGRTDIPLTERGREQASRLEGVLKPIVFSAAFTSPLVRAAETARLAGLGSATKCDDLMEFDYGKYDGLTIAEIRQQVPDWTVWTRPCPSGETLEDVGKRARRMIDMVAQYEGNVALVAHGHVLRILTATWLGLGPSAGGMFTLDTATVSILSHERDVPVISLWNATSCPASG